MLHLRIIFNFSSFPWNRVSESQDNYFYFLQDKQKMPPNNADSVKHLTQAHKTAKSKLKDFTQVNVWAEEVADQKKAN